MKGAVYLEVLLQDSYVLRHVVKVEYKKAGHKIAAAFFVHFNLFIITRFFINTTHNLSLI